MFLQLYLFSWVSSIVTPNLRLYFIVSTIIINSSQASQGSIASSYYITDSFSNIHLPTGG